MNQTIRFVLVAGVVLLAAFAVEAGLAEELETDITVPVIINLLEGSGATVDEAALAVEQASAIYKQAKIRLQIIKVNEAVPRPGNGDDNLSESERNDLRKSGATELPVSPTGVTQGVKVTFGKVPDETDPGVLGLAVHKDPVAIVGKNAKTAETVAHEFGHIFTLPDLKPPYPGHGRLMWGYADNGGTLLTPAEIAEIRGEAARRGLVWTWVPGNPDAPSAPGQNQRGAKAAPGIEFDPGAEPYKDVFFATMTSPNATADFDLRLELGGTVPTAVDATYRVLLNADNNPLTGEQIAGQPGIDRVIRAEVLGPGGVQFFLDTPGGVSTALTDGTLIREPEFVDHATALATERPNRDVLDVQVPRSLLALAGGNPVLNAFAISGADPNNPVDFLSMPLDMFSDTRGPQLMADRGLVNRTGDVLSLTGIGFHPDAQVNILLDNQSLGMVQADSSGSFNIPSLSLPNLTDDFYFLTALDAANGEFGGAVVHTAVPEPSTLAMLGVGVFGVLCWVWGRRRLLRT